MLETLIEIAPLLCGRSPPALAHAARVAVLTTTGGGAASVVDRMGMHGLETVAPDATLRERLAALGVQSLDSPIIDLTMAATGKRYADVLEVLLESPACDAVLAVVGSSAQFHPQLAIEPILRSPRTTKPLAVFLTPHAERSLALLAERGIAAFRTPESCADALAAFFAWRVPRRTVGSDRDRIAPRLAQRTAAPRQTPRSPGTCAFLRAWACRRSSRRSPVRRATSTGSPTRSRQKFSRPISRTRPRRAGSRCASPAAASSMSKCAHCSSSAAAAQPAARVEGIIVQRMEVGLAEVIVGYRHDDMVGPLVLVGAGGTLAEIYGDYALRLAPVSEHEAATMIEEVKGLAMLRGYRNLPRGDVAALAKVVVALSRLALVPGQPVAEAEINPLIVNRRGGRGRRARCVQGSLQSADSGTRAAELTTLQSDVGCRVDSGSRQLRL